DDAFARIFVRFADNKSIRVQTVVDTLYHLPRRITKHASFGSSSGDICLTTTNEILTCRHCSHRHSRSEALRFNVTELSAAAVAFSLIVGPKSDKAATDCTDADCVEADSVESVSHAVRFNTVVQIE